MGPSVPRCRSHSRWPLALRIAGLELFWWLGGKRIRVDWTWGETGASVFWAALYREGSHLLRESGTPAYEFSVWYLELEGRLYVVLAEEWEPYVVLVPGRLVSRVEAAIRRAYDSLPPNEA